MGREIVRSPQYKPDEQPPRGEVIGPLSWEVARLADNYSVQPVGTTRFVDEHGEVLEGFLWKEAPTAKRTVDGRIIAAGVRYSTQEEWIENKKVERHFIEGMDGFDADNTKKCTDTRGHAPAFYARLEELREAGEILWSDNVSYFTHAEGQEARAEFKKGCLEGWVIPNARIWDNQFKQETGKSAEDLHLMRAERKEAKGPMEQMQDDGDKLLQSIRNQRQTQPNDDDVKNIEKEEVGPADEELQVIQEEAEVTARPSAETPILDPDEVMDPEEDEEDDSDDHDIDVHIVEKSEYEHPERISEDCFVFRKSNELQDTLVLLVDTEDGEQWREVNRAWLTTSGRKNIIRVN